MTTSCPVAAEPKQRAHFAFSAFFVPALLGAAITLSPAVSLAGDPAAAEALFRAAKGLMDKKNYTEACPKFEASYKLDPAVGTKLNLADCLEKEGKLAQAWVAWGDAHDQAKKEGDAPRADLAARRQNELDPRVPTLSVTVKGSAAGLAVYRDDVALEPASLGVPLPVDPGNHAITLRRGDKVLKEKSVESKEKGKDEVEIDATDVPPPPPDVATGPTPQPKEKTVMVRRSKGLMAGGIVLSVFGGLTFFTGVILLVPNQTRGGGVAATLIGGGMTAGGIAMAVSGSRKVPKTVEVSSPTLFIGPTSVMFQSSF